MPLTKGRIERSGIVSFHDASVSVWEDGHDRNATRAEREAWDLSFKRQVFARIVQQLNRLGWTCAMPPRDLHAVKHYGGDVERWSRQRKRLCAKGHMKGELSLSGRHIEFKMWQDFTKPDNPNGGQYDFNKEARMPYALRLEMERTRRRIREYLCNVFTGYSFKPPKIDSPNPDPLSWFNDSWDSEYERARGTHRFERGPDGWPTAKAIGIVNCTDGDGALIHNGDMRWARDDKGRMFRGRVYDGINGTWVLVHGPGKRDTLRVCHKALFSLKPGDSPRKVINPLLRSKRLEAELKKAIEAKDFLRAHTLNTIIESEKA